MSSRRQNLSLFIEHPSSSSNRTARVVQMPDFESYEITKENHPFGHDGPITGSSYKYQKTPSGTLLTFQGSHMSGLAEKYEHPEHVPVFLDYDEKTGSMYHIERQEGRNRLNNSGRRDSPLEDDEDDEYEAIRMTFPARGDSVSTPQIASQDGSAIVSTPPPKTISRPRQNSESRKSPRPRSRRTPSRVASSAQLRVSPAPHSSRQRTKSAVNKSEPYPGIASFHPMLVAPTINKAVETASQCVLPDNQWEGVYKRNDGIVLKEGEVPSDPKVKGKLRSLFKKRN